MNKKKKEIQINYLDLIPERSTQLRWHPEIRGRMVLEIENKGALNTIAQTLVGKPRYTKIHLDDNGTFIWPLIDGRKTVEDIAALVKGEFGEKAEPLYPRIIKYFQIMESYHFVNFINKPGK